MVALAVVVAVVAVPAVVLLQVNHASVPGWLQAFAIGVLVLPFITALAIRWTYWREVSDAVEVTERQYPEMRRVFDEQVVRGGFDHQPRRYVKNGNGVLNAFASSTTA